ncbi:hypothetical protein BDR05DRAFT_953763 [Suillus weaverae]|nr:hypothetical protein BDR05DRAFT_953763 [Suillus weaverae]
MVTPNPRISRSPLQVDHRPTTVALRADFNMDFNPSQTSQQIIVGNDHHHQNTSHPVRWFGNPHPNILSDPNQASQAMTHPQNTHHPAYVDLGLHVNPQDQCANQPSYVDPLHPQHHLTHVDSGPHVNSQDGYTNQSSYIHPGTSHPQSVHHPTCITVNSELHLNLQDHYANQSSFVDSGISHLQSIHHLTNVDLRAHMNPQDPYTEKLSCVDPGTSHHQSMQPLPYIDSGPHVNPQDQYVNQPSYTNPGTLHSQSMHHPPTHHVDSGFHANLQDHSANQPPYIDPGTSHPESMHGSMYAVDSGSQMNPHEQYTNQSYDIAPQGSPLPQITHHSMCAELEPPMNPDYQHDADSQTYISTYIDSMLHANPHDQSARSEQLVSVPQKTHHPPSHGLDSHYHVGNSYYHAPHPNIPYQQTDPLPQSSDWIHNINRLHFHRTSSQHTPYTSSNRCNEYLLPRNVDHGATQIMPPVPDVQPVTVPPPAFTTVSPAPDTLLSTPFTTKCHVVASSFFMDVAAIEKMANQCMDAKTQHDKDLVTWSKSEEGKTELSKLCNILGTIKKNVQLHSHSAVLWGYDLHYVLMEKPKRKKYINYIGQDWNIQHLLNFVGILFNWVFSEILSGMFKEQDLKMNEKTHHCDALVKSIFTQGGVTI